MDGWQRPAVDPLPAMMYTTPGAATTTAPPPVPPPLVSPLSGHPPAPAPVPGAPVIPTLRPSRIGPSKEIGAENAAAKADVPPAQWRVTRPARYAVIGVAGMMMALGLFALPWVEAVGGKGVITYRYPKLANVVAAYHGGNLNWWQHLYLQWFAVVLAAAMLAAVTATVTVVIKPPPPAPGWTWAVFLLIGALAVGHVLGIPLLWHDTAVAQVSGAGPFSVFVGYGLLLLVCPTPPGPIGRRSVQSRH